jgi:hypothetical protein
VREDAAAAFDELSAVLADGAAELAVFFVDGDGFFEQEGVDLCGRLFAAE